MGRGVRFLRAGKTHLWNMHVRWNTTNIHRKNGNESFPFTLTGILKDFFEDNCPIFFIHISSLSLGNRVLRNLSKRYLVHSIIFLIKWKSGRQCLAVVSKSLRCIQFIWAGEITVFFVDLLRPSYLFLGDIFSALQESCCCLLF